ncbi:hypothetical protein DICPUDRAFT_35993 [Dictyostelium purpureum]|uniref:Major facilitator superfamily (MFS) profile domain-containing protein n=1 Tax=Dictyostelium purpureum TaxID=5786 RepID=F0ZQ77_DICPU|nr:uncharacterized protein DICPUDRAFT_35993 [Dictyostelium purpureum]EGC33888.1 hypothetical protein DICPUDRAFT_35993 [Dictyostelium purpureum]|eukprot:XP_003289571.1 hypothetical protein DICPUDRAFT_35993 [Dictyostelium purpureum]
MTELIKSISSKPWLVVTQSCLGGLIFGYATGIIVGALDPITAKFGISTPIKGVVVCSILLGAMIGSFAGGFVADKFGRKPLLLFTAITTIGGALGSGFGTNIPTICALRFIHGLGVGSSSSVCPLMVSEMVPLEKKGIYGSFFQISITVGILIANILALAIKGQWKLMFCLGAIPGALLFVVWCFIAESPVYLSKKRAAQTASPRTNSPQLVEPTQQQSGNKFTVLFQKDTRKPMLLGILLAVLAQLTGINAFMYFSTTIFKDAGINSGDDPQIAAIILQVWNVLTTLIAIFLVDRLGRRILLFTGSGVMTVCDLLIALFFVTLSGAAKGWTSIVFLFIFVAAFEASIGTLFWFVINEILPEKSKSIGAPVINAFQWTFNLILSFFFLVVVEKLGQSTMFWIFGGIGLACTVLLYFNLPRSLGTSTQVSENDIANEITTDEGEESSSNYNTKEQKEKQKEKDRENYIKGKDTFEDVPVSNTFQA